MYPTLGREDLNLTVETGRPGTQQIFLKFFLRFFCDKSAERWLYSVGSPVDFISQEIQRHRVSKQ